LKSEEVRVQVVLIAPVQSPVKPKPFRSHNIASKPAIVRRADEIPLQAIHEFARSLARASDHATKTRRPSML